MNKTKQKGKIYFFFSLIFTLLMTACGVKNYNGFVAEDARFANYVPIGNGSNGLVYYEDEINPGELAVGLGTCTDQNIVVDDEYDDKPVTSVYPAGFQNCTTIKTIELPDTIEVFGTDAFAGSSLQTITIPNEVSVISTGAFRNCKQLASVDFDKTLNSVIMINDYAFANDFTLSYFPFHKLTHLTTIGKEAFLYCLGLRSIIFPDSFTTLESYAFQDCKGLTTIYFGENITSIGAYAFRGVGQQAKIYFSEDRPTTVDDCGIDDPNASTTTPFEYVHNFSFGNYYVPVVFGVGKLIIDGQFHYSRPETGTYVLNKYTSDNNGNWVNKNTAEYTETIAEDEVILWNFDDDGRTELNIPATVEWGDTYKVVGIKSDVFEGNTTITSVKFHENLRFIDAGAFRGCTKLKEIDLGSAVDLKHIQSRAFYNTMPQNARDVDHMYSIHIPSNVENIGADAFRGCIGLWKLYFDGAASELEETFICTSDTANTFTLPYTPVSVTSVTLDGPDATYTVSGKTITITSGVRKTAVVRVKYTTNSTTTQRFTGGIDAGGTPITEFVLAAKAEAIGSVKVDGVVKTQGTDFTLTNIDNNTKTKITFTSAPAEDKPVIVEYRANSKLTSIAECAFHTAANGVGGATFYSLNLRQYNNAFPNVYFPASLTSIGEYAFAKGEFIGAAIFQSPSLTIRSNAFAEQKCLSSIIFPTSVTALNLYEKSFASGLGVNECVAGGGPKKLISVTLPKNTTVYGNEVFSGHILLSIYCIQNTPTIKNSKTSWHKIGTEIPKAFGDFKAPRTTIDHAPVYVVDSVDDIVSVPSKEHPIFDFVKEQGQTTATLTNFHYYGGRIKDNNGNMAILPGKSLFEYKQANINPDFSSEYLIGLGNGHFRAEVPIQVYIGGEYINVTKIGQSALAMQMNEEGMKPNTGSKTGKNYTSDAGYYYWQSNSNYWTMREITIPDTIETIAACGLAFIPFNVLKTYEVGASKVSVDTLSKIWNGGTISADGKFPSALKTLAHMACSFTGLTRAKLPNGLTSFNGIDSTHPATDDSWYSWPFIGCFDLIELSIYNSGNASPVFTSNGVVISYASSGQMLEGAEGAPTMVIPWGTTSTAAGALRGGRRITDLSFPYTITKVAKYFLDTIGSSVDSQGWSGTSALTHVTFSNAAESGITDDTIKANYATPKCKEIAESAFWGGTSIQTLELPISIETLGPKAFRNCSGITNIYVDHGTQNTAPFTQITNTDLGKHLNLAAFTSLSSIGSECFAGCASLTELTTSERITNFQSITFQDCKALVTANFHANTTSIGTSCFSGCTKLANLNFAGDTITFSDSAFNNCDALKTVNIPEGSHLYKTVFNGCDGLDDNVNSGGGVIVGKNTTFHYSKDTSAFLSCPSSTKIYLMDTAAEYIAGKNANRYPEAWNYRSYSNNSGTDLKFYVYSDTQPEQSNPNYGFWHMVAGVPTIWSIAS